MSVHAARAKFWLFSILLAFVALSPGWATADDDDRRGLRRPFDRIVVFGTSLSDPGNAFALSHQHLEPPYVSPALNPVTLVPESEWPYAVGGNRFSNGPTWVEQLAKPLGLSDSVKPAYLGSTDGSSNYAVGGTRARGGVIGEITLSQQVTNFLRDVGPHAPSRALYVIEVGSNDVSDALLSLPAERPGILGATLGAVAGAINALYHQAGARKFLVWNVPNLGRTPAIRTVDRLSGAGGAIVAGAEALSRAYNEELRKLLDALPNAPLTAGGVPGADIIQFDAFGRLEDVVGHPRRYRLQNVTDACIKPGTPPPSRCEDQDRFLFWDGFHPTRAGHTIVAIEVGKTLAADLLAH
jgi:phospholipase/lecithinase/hemolysin